MKPERLITITAIVAIAVSLATCDRADDSGERDASTAKTATRAESAIKGALSRPIHPTCTLPGFRGPKVREVVPAGSKEQTWSLSYNRGGSNPQASNRTTQLVIVETAATAPQSENLPGFQMVTVAGRRVAFNRPGKGKKVRTFAAHWRTDRARYTVLANGTRDTVIKRVIGCLP